MAYNINITVEDYTGPEVTFGPGAPQGLSGPIVDALRASKEDGKVKQIAGLSGEKPGTIENIANRIRSAAKRLGYTVTIKKLSDKIVFQTTGLVEPKAEPTVETVPQAAGKRTRATSKS